MLKFGGGTSRRPLPNYQSGAGRRKLLGIVALIGLAVLAVKAAINPDNWRWPQQAPPPGPTDTVLRQVVPPEPMEGEFQAPAPEAPPKPPAARKLFPGVREDYLAEVRDSNFFRAKESHAFFHLFKILHDSDPAQIKAASIGAISFAQLHDQPEAYRGEIVTTRGRLRQLQRMDVGPNEFEVDHYYQVTLQPNDNPTFPMLVYVRELPESFPSQLTLPAARRAVTVEEFNEEVEVTGFFYKRLAYKAKDNVRTAPLILAQSFDWRATPAPGSVATNTTRDFRYLAASVTLGLLLLVILSSWSRGSLTRWFGSVRPAPTSAELQRLGELDPAPTASEHLKKLEQESAGDPNLPPPFMPKPRLPPPERR